MLQQTVVTHCKIQYTKACRKSEVSDMNMQEMCILGDGFCCSASSEASKVLLEGRLWRAGRPAVSSGGS